MKTMIREIREDMARIREENKVCTKKGICGSDRGEGEGKERISGSERGDESKTRKVAGGGSRLDKNDRGINRTKRKEGEEE
jgi:hypothetical protein